MTAKKSLPIKSGKQENNNINKQLLTCNMQIIDNHLSLSSLAAAAAAASHAAEIELGLHLSSSRLLAYIFDHLD